MKTITLLTTLLIVLAVIACEKEDILQPDQSQAEEIAIRAGGPPDQNPPVANAAADQVTILPINTVRLNGSATDPDNNIRSYQWTKIAGPSSCKIVSPKSAQTQVTNLVEGTYRFELKVTDKTNLFDKDTVQVTVGITAPPPCTTCTIVFVSDRDGNFEIYTCNTDGSNITRLTTHPATEDQPEWSPDGTRIAFTSNRDGYSNLYIMNADGSNIVQRTFSVEPNGSIWSPTWSPDGTKIAYAEQILFVEEEDYSYTSSIYSVNAESGSPLLLIGYGESPAWSPDGTKIALSGIYIMNSDGTGLTPLTVNTGYYNSSFGFPSWSPSGAKLAVEYRGSNDNGVPHLGVMNSDGSGFTVFMRATGSTSWSADSTVIVYNSVSGSMYNVSWVAANGSAAGTIVTNGWNADWKH